jgi:acyl-CoA thioesterase FadM
MNRASDGLLLVTCRQALAMVQMPQGKPMRLPEDWFTKYPHLVLKKGRETRP